MGWEEDGPFNVVTDRGLKLCLIETPPPLMAKLMREAIQRVHEAGMIKGRPAEQLEEGCSRICVDHVRNALCSKRLRGPPGLASALTAVAGGTWTAERAHDAGYVVPEEALVCPLCRAGPDSFHHRLGGARRRQRQGAGSASGHWSGLEGRRPRTPCSTQGPCRATREIL